MKLKDTIDRIDRLKVNTVDFEDKLDWISELDQIIYDKILTKAVDYTGTFRHYTEEDESKELLLPRQYADIYLFYVSAKIDFLNGEITSYNNNMALYNSAYDDYAAFYRRTHMPK